ncbi:MAG TPA: DUF2779 domain-containing protein [Gemmatimonadaceae bacterium]|nr:DUF2779 domain-containing protein [Gemmatimonadaceae bacterium]
MPTLSKKTVLAGLQCHKRLWWQVHDRAAEELRESLIMQYRMREGAEVGQLARSYVPGGHLVERGNRSLAALIAETRGALATPNIPAIYEGAFSAADTTVYTDILERVDDGWVLIEVKATTSVSEAEHVPDIAVQACVLRKCGVPVVRYEIMHLNRACEFPDLSNLFVREDATEAVRARLDDLDREIGEQHRVLERDEPPAVATGAHCAKPSECPFRARCWPPRPEHHVTTLYRIGPTKAESYIASGWNTIHDLPESVKLSAVAARQRRAVRQGAMIVERESLVDALALVDRPVAHIDFETVQLAVPRWNGCHPYDQIPVQLSAHVVHADGSTAHRAWLYDGDGDPRAEAAHAILDACRGARTVTAYYSPFEKECIRLVARAVPEHAAELNAIADAIVDLLPIVREHVYHPAFGGSFSLKKVLPVLVPELSYEGMPIAEGQTAQVQLTRLMFEPGMSAEERREIRDALLEYCELDTYAMVALENRLRDLAQ